MIKRRNLDKSLQAELDGLSSLATKFGLGNIWYVDPNAGGSGVLGDINSGGGGESWEEALESITAAFTVVKSWDTILCAPGNHTGNHATPLNAAGPFGSLIAMRATSLGLAAWAGATTVTSPIINVRARGWRISGFEFDNPSTSFGVNLRKEATLVNRCDYTEVDHCLFTGGQGAINFQGGGTYCHFHDNRFDLMAGSTAREDGGIVVSDSSYQLPGMCLVENNIFLENIFHINMGASWGFNSSVIKGNVFQLLGSANTATVLLDIRGGAGCQVVGNYFGCTIAQYKDDSSTAFIRSTADTEGMGNMCNDGPADGDISV